MQQGMNLIYYFLFTFNYHFLFTFKFFLNFISNTHFNLSCAILVTNFSAYRDALNIRTFGQFEVVVDNIRLVTEWCNRYYVGKIFEQNSSRLDTSIIFSIFCGS